LYFAGVQNLRLKVWRVHVILVELTTLPTKANLAHRYLAEYQAIPAPAAGWLGSDTKLDYADTNSHDFS
jgi:hypothetical protein